MGFYVLHDRENDRAILYDSTSESPIETPGFLGGSARELAESFLAYLHTDHCEEHRLSSDLLGVRPDGGDPRCYSKVGLERARERWYAACTTGETDELNEYGLRLWEWWIGSRREPAPEPVKEAVA